MDQVGPLAFRSGRLRRQDLHPGHDAGRIRALVPGPSRWVASGRQRAIP